MEFGIVSNCWRAQLESGVPLDDLVRDAVQRGYGHVELRQGCLGAHERASDGGTVPEPVALMELQQRFPATRFNLALALPYLGGEVTPATPLFETGVRAAVFLSGAGHAHLRLVDTETAPEALTTSRRVEVAERLVSLAATCADAGARLSVENARQPWSALREILQRTRARLGERAGALGLCYDPCNLLSASDRPDPEAETERLPAGEIMLFHYKQNQSGEAAPEVGPGEIDWGRQLRALERIGYQGPRLFEIPAGPDIWERLERSRDYLRGLVGQSAGH